MDASAWRKKKEEIIILTFQFRSNEANDRKKERK